MMVERIRFQNGLPPLAATGGIHKARRRQKDASGGREKQAHAKKKRRDPSPAEEVEGVDQAGTDPEESRPAAKGRKKTIDIVV
jgi:hypothetical protein